ncbi:hypothetical protein VSDG_06543 [Cytospora chrysosperma]|uniref:Uncharacterized protein n=1 Tax=Cytospora chrysosperma TaxID=252740 RepID=A0A423VNY6_CYTCH|nr:hypothetical protein VSDG_06543 [Valsa sordida]
MAALQSQTPCPDCDCSDSALSITGNILGILAFAVAVYASLLYYYRGFRDSKVEQLGMLKKVLQAKEDLTRISQAHCLLTRRSTQTSWSGIWMHIVEVSSLRSRAAYLLERENVVEALERMEASTRDCLFQQPLPTFFIILNMVSVLEEIKMQDNGLRLVVEDVLRRVSALENWPRERTTEPRLDEEE